MQRSWLAGAAPPLLSLMLAAPREAEAVMFDGGWHCQRVGIAVGDGAHEWSTHCEHRGDSGGGGFAGRNPNDGGSHGGGGGGGAARPNPGAKEQETNDRIDASTCSRETSGNPVVLYTGNKVEPEVDFVTNGEMPLRLARTYNHHWNGIGLFGKHWLSNFDYTLAFSTNTAWAQRPDGRRIKFLFDAASNQWKEDRAQPLATLARNADGTYTLRNEQRGTETYDADGYILERRNEQGIAWTFKYANKQLQEVTHASGRSVRFVWSNGVVAQATDPAGNVWKYTYTPNVFTGRARLASTQLPGSPATTIAYHYEDARFPGGLTGKSFNGARYSTFAYDAQGRAISTERAGGVERYTFDYVVEASEELPLAPQPPPPGGFTEDDALATCNQWLCTRERTITTQARPTRFRVIETNPLGRKTTHQYENGRKVSVTGAASPSCPASYRELTYDANGFEDIVSDNTDRLTDFDYDAHGRLVKTVEAAGSPVSRTTLQTWDEATQRLTRSTLVGHRDTQFAYGADGRVDSVVVTNLSTVGVPGQSRTTRHHYFKHPNGLLSAQHIDGPQDNDTLKMTYAVTGDLLSIEDTLGRTFFSDYTAMGMPGRVTGSNGEATEYVYDARGRLVTKRQFVSGTAQSTHYTYDARGLLASVQSPDGRTIHYVHDAAHRLVEEYEREPAGTYARKLTTYNAMSQPLSVEVHRTVQAGGTPLIPETAPAGLSAPAQSTTGTYTVSWSAGDRAATYRLEESTNNGAWVLVHDAAPTSKVVSGKGAATYRYRVASCNASGCGPWSNAISVVEIDPPTAIPTVSAPAINTTGAYSVSWNAVANATAYRLEESAGGAWAEIQNLASTSKALTGKSTNVDRHYRVRACNAAGCGSYSASKLVQRIIYDAQVLSHVAPDHMLSDEQATITVTVRNSGNVAWPATGFYLGRNDGRYTMPASIPLTAAVAPGATTTFRHTFVAPRGPVSPMPTYYFGGRMAGNGIGWFGQAAPERSTRVENPFGHCPGGGQTCQSPYSLGVQGVAP